MNPIVSLFVAAMVTIGSVGSGGQQVLASSASQSSNCQTADFDWSMERPFQSVFWSHDRGVRDEQQRLTVPDSWNVKFRVTKGDGPHWWEFWDAREPTATGPTPTATFPGLGAYYVSLKSGTGLSLCTKLVEVMDYLIASMGDSYASGEGNPVAPGNPAPPLGNDGLWGSPDARQCHRSRVAGPHVAAERLADEKRSVTFIHLACSGARIPHLSEPYDGIDGNLPQLPSQADQLRDLICREQACRRVDALTISIGGNDARFSSIIMKCAIEPHCDESGPPPQWAQDLCNETIRRLDADPLLCSRSARQIFDDSIVNLAPRYRAFDTRLQAALFNRPAAPWANPALPRDTILDSKRVFLTEYPDMTMDSNGDYCDTFWDRAGQEIFRDTGAGGLRRGATRLIDDLAQLEIQLDAKPPNPPELLDAIRRVYGDLGRSVADLPTAADLIGLLRVGEDLLKIKNNPAITRSEAQWASDTMRPRLDQEVRAGAGAAGWNYVGGIAGPFVRDSEGRGHGYCAGNPAVLQDSVRWINQLWEGLWVEGLPTGGFHPNAAGNRLYADRIVDAVRPILQSASATPLPPRPLTGQFGGEWRLSGSGFAAASHSALLQQTGDRICGTFRLTSPAGTATNIGRIEGTVYGNLVRAIWSDGGGFGPLGSDGDFSLAVRDAQHLGQFQSVGQQARNNWSAGRAPGPAPAVCPAPDAPVLAPAPALVTVPPAIPLERACSVRNLVLGGAPDDACRADPSRFQVTTPQVITPLVQERPVPPEPQDRVAPPVDRVAAPERVAAPADRALVQPERVVLVRPRTRGAEACSIDESTLVYELDLDLEADALVGVEEALGDLIVEICQVVNPEPGPQ